MKVLEFLNACLERGWTTEQALTSLEERYAIKSRIYKDLGLVVLNYNQINSPKFDEITKECRSLVLGLPVWDTTSQTPSGLVCLDGFYVVSRAFDRFFNHTEDPSQELDFSKVVFHDKLDGSLVSLFHHRGKWLYRTKSMIMPVDTINGLDVTWKDLIEEALYIEGALPYLNKDWTFIFEVVSPYNRIVTRYEKPQAYLLAIRNNLNGDYAQAGYIKEACYFVDKWELPKVFIFDTVDSCLQGAKDRPNLEEGYVGYLNGVPVVKVKNPAYVVAHHIRGEGTLTPKRIVDLILIGEVDEYLSIFPEDTEHFNPWLVAYDNVFRQVPIAFDELNVLESQKEFAIGVMKGPTKKVSSLLFSMRKGLTLDEAWDKLSRNAKQSTLEAMK